eukprot:PLAT143.15.p2 GENE.PLAT143.15~~PLAT143.15.p2  ORF type:complete len:743 (-),score=386.00 PLAT143.15:1745-3820(-)
MADVIRNPPPSPSRGRGDRRKGRRGRNGGRGDRRDRRGGGRRDRSDRGGDRGRHGGGGSWVDEVMIEHPPELLQPITASETAWKSRVIGGSEAEGVEALRRRARGLLNKLTPEKFDRLVDQFIEIGWATVDLMQLALQLIVMKASQEPNFCFMYADLCAHLHNRVVVEDPPEGISSEKVMRKLLLVQCQLFFEREQDPASLEGLAEDDKQEQIAKFKFQKLGHIRFVGELFKKGFLSTKVIVHCVSELLGSGDFVDEESFACFGKLLPQVGKLLEKSKKQASFCAAMWERIEELSTSEAVSSKTRFLMLDLKELKRNRWQARREEEKAKTLAEVHADARREESKKSRGGRGRRTPRRREKAVVTEDGWSVARGGGGGPPSPSRKRQKSPRKKERGGRGGRGAGGDDVRNRFAMLDGGARAGGKAGKRDRRRGGGGGGGGGGGSSDDARRPAPIDAAAAAPRPRSASRGASGDAATPASKSGKPAPTREELKRKTKAILEEFFAINLMGEAVDCVRELELPSWHSSFVTEGLAYSMDRDERSRDQFNQLLKELKTVGLFTDGHLRVGVEQFLELYEDLSIDMPRLSSYFGIFLARMIGDELLPLSFLKHGLHDLVESWKAHRLAFAVLEQLKKDMDGAAFDEAYVDSGITFRDFFVGSSQEEANNFLIEKEFPLPGEDTVIDTLAAKAAKES